MEYTFNNQCSDCKYYKDGKCTHEHAVYCQHCELWTPKWFDDMRKEDISTIHRMLGKIEGVAFVVEDKIATPLLDAVEVIESVLNREEGADNDRK